MSYVADSMDAFLIKTDSAGVVLWARTYGDTSWEFASALTTTPDGGYALAGGARSYGAGNYDAFLVKTDGAGTTCIGASPSPTVTSPSPTVTSPSPTVTSPAPAETTACYNVAVTERSPIGAARGLTVRFVRGGLAISASAPTSVAIYRADGALARRLEVSGTARVALAPGVYLLRGERGGTLTAVVAR